MCVVEVGGELIQIVFVYGDCVQCDELCYQCGVFVWYVVEGWIGGCSGDVGQVDVVFD